MLFFLLTPISHGIHCCVPHKADTNNAEGHLGGIVSGASDFRSGHDLTVRESESHGGLTGC